ncbi:hypothetical protein TNCV_3167981 [Trichonephila clavipes]|uniref:Uncharacterized protein n=1 Tax=Trichonephila clavipes TaxID=2585209 RepID=A0A8X6REA2_TRICX|nr:hypothetical protein TNCV_3167981 [Trichonephila clavipes]
MTTNKLTNKFITISNKEKGAISNSEKEDRDWSRKRGDLVEQRPAEIGFGVRRRFADERRDDERRWRLRTRNNALERWQAEVVVDFSPAHPRSMEILCVILTA